MLVLNHQSVQFAVQFRTSLVTWTKVGITFPWLVLKNSVLANHSFIYSFISLLKFQRFFEPPMMVRVHNNHKKNKKNLN